MTMTSIQGKEQVYKVLISRNNDHKYPHEEHDESSTARCLENHESSKYHSYILRGLKNEDEVPKWCEFCADVFSYKKSNPPPAEYFYRHYVNDPSTSSTVSTTNTANSNPGGPSLVRVAIYKNQIVASCRIFLRSISTGRIFANTITNTTEVEEEDTLVALNCGGIGEVCTAKNHRRRGLSTQLLKTAIEIMKELRHNNTDKNNIQISSLHASPIFFQFYESFGYTSTACDNGGNRWSIVPVTMMLGKQEPNENENNTYDISQSSSHRTSTSTSNNHCNNKTVPPHVVVRPAKFPQDTEQLHQLHRIYSEQRFVGCIIRSKEYWTNYISQELKGSLFVLVIQPVTSKQQHNGDGINDDNDNNDRDDTEDNNNVEVKDVIVAWLSLRITGSTNAATTSSSSDNDDDEDERCRRVRSFQIQEFGMNLSLLPDYISSSSSSSSLSPIPSPPPQPPPTTEDYSNNYYVSIYFAFKTLIQHALMKEQQQEQQQHKNNDNNNEYGGVTIKERTVIKTKTTISLSIPGFLRDEIYYDSSNSNSNSNSNISGNVTITDDDGCDGDNDDNEFYLDWKSEQTNTDNGWMYQVLPTITPMSTLLLPATDNNSNNNNNKKNNTNNFNHDNDNDNDNYNYNYNYNDNNYNNNNNNNNNTRTQTQAIKFLDFTRQRQQGDMYDDGEDDGNDKYYNTVNNDISCATKNNNNPIVVNSSCTTHSGESQSQSQQRMEHFIWPSDSF